MMKPTTPWICVLVSFLSVASSLGTPGIPNSGGHGTSLVLNFSKTPISFLGRAVPFPFFGENETQLAHWISPEFGFLVMPDTGGKVGSGAQLFGSEMELYWQNRLAKNGFEALAQFDHNGDGVINPNDQVFEDLAVWFDRNSDGVSQPDEVVSLASLGITKISLGFKNITPVVIPKGSFVGLTGAFERADENGNTSTNQIADVYFAR